MPALAFLAVAGFVLTALLFVADAKLKNSSSPAIVTSQRTGLPQPQYHNATRTLTNTPAPAPDMTSQAVLAAQPKTETKHQATIPAEARAARAQAPAKKRGPRRHPKTTRTRRRLPTTRPHSSTDFRSRIIEAGSLRLTRAVVSKSGRTGSVAVRDRERLANQSPPTHLQAMLRSKQHWSLLQWAPS